MQAVLPLAAGHHAARELVDDDDLTIDRDVIAVFQVGDLGAERALDVFVEPVNGQTDECRIGGNSLNLAPAGSGQLGLALERIVLVILDANQRGRELVGPIIRGRFFLGRLVVGTDDQRCSRLVDQDAVGLVDDRVVMGTLHGHLTVVLAATAEVDLFETLAVAVAAQLQFFQLVAQEVEAKLLGRAVGDVARVVLRDARCRSDRSGCSRRSGRATGRSGAIHSASRRAR